MRDIGITHGNESKVGYYVGMLVNISLNPLVFMLIMKRSNLYFS